MARESFALPVPLPPRLPDESTNAYRRRVVPGFIEHTNLSWRRKQFTRSELHRLTAEMGCTLSQEQTDHLRPFAYDLWSRRNPESAARLAFLSKRVARRVYPPD